MPYLELMETLGMSQAPPPGIPWVISYRTSTRVAHDLAGDEVAVCLSTQFSSRSVTVFEKAET